MRWPQRLRPDRAGLLVALLSTAILIAVLAPIQHRVGLLNEGLLFLLLTLLIAGRWGLRVGLFAAVLTNLALNFFFVEPLHEFTVQEPRNAFGLGVFLVVSVVGSSLLANARAAANEARRRQAETQALLELSRAMIGQTDPNDALRALCLEVLRALQSPGASVLRQQPGGWVVLASAGQTNASRPVDSQERVMAEEAVDAGGIRRLGRPGLESSRRVRIVRHSSPRRFDEPATGTAFVPLRIGERTLGVLRLDGPFGETPFRDEPEHLLDAFAVEAALAVQRVELAQAASHADALRQADEMKTALLTSVSHDLKTPLAGIKTAVSSLLDATVNWSPDDRQAFLETIDSQSDRLNRVISDILDLNRIEAGAVLPSLRPVEARSLLEDVRERVALVTSGRELTVEAPIETLISTDESLISQALVNLVENAARYSTPGAPIHLRGVPAGPNIELIVEDEGPGIAPADLPHVFERFYRADEHSRRVRGSGLGLAIVSGFVQLCGGSVRVESSPAGTRFIITLPAAVRRKASA